MIVYPKIKPVKNGYGIFVLMPSYSDGIKQLEEMQHGWTFDEIQEDEEVLNLYNVKIGETWSTVFVEYDVVDPAMKFLNIEKSSMPIGKLVFLENDEEENELKELIERAKISASKRKAYENFLVEQLKSR